MIFSELYGAYYNTVAAVLRKAVQRPLTKEDLRTVIERCAFSESVLSIEPALTSEKWQLLRPDGTTPPPPSADHAAYGAAKAVAEGDFFDPRIRLFDFDSSGRGCAPLFTPDDIYIFDRYADGDPFEDEVYIQIFHRILDAIKKRYPLSIDVKNRREAPQSERHAGISGVFRKGRQVPPGRLRLPVRKNHQSWADFCPVSPFGENGTGAKASVPPQTNAL